MTADTTARAAVPRPAKAADPEHPGWEDIRRAILTTVELAAIVLEEIRGGGDGGGGQGRRAELISRTLVSLGRPVESIVLDEAIMAQREARAYDQGFQAGLAARRPRRGHHLRKVSDG